MPAIPLGCSLSTWRSGGYQLSQRRSRSRLRHYTALGCAGRARQMATA